MSHALLIAIGYGVTWLSIAAYLVHLGRRERAARRQLAEVRRLADVRGRGEGDEEARRTAGEEGQAPDEGRQAPGDG